MADHKRGRKLARIEGCGPAAEFGHRLREELEARGAPSRMAIARASNVGSSTVSTIDNGRSVPAADKVNDYLVGLGVAKDERERWAAEREHYAARAARLHPDLSQSRTRERLRQALLGVLDGEGVDAATAWRRVTEAGADGPAMTRTPAPPTRDEIDAVFVGRPGALTSAVLPWVVYAAGGTRADIVHWQVRFGELPDEAVGSADPAGSVDWPDASNRSAAAGHPDASLETLPAPVIPRQHPLRTPASRSAVVTAEPGAQVKAATAGPQPTPVGGRTWWLRPVPFMPWAAVVGVCVVIAVGAVLGVLHLDLRTRHLAKSVAVPAPVPEQPGRKAGVFLEDTAARIMQTPGPAPSGAFAYVHRTTWAVETTPGNGAPGKTGAAESIKDEKLWWSQTERGLQIITESEPGQIDQTNEVYLPPGPPTDVGPPASDPDVLWQRLEHQQPARLGPVRCLRAVTDLIDIYPLDTAQRAAVLRLVAGCDGIAHRDQQLDRLGRPGIGVSADDARNRTRDTLIIDENTGAILAREVTRTGTLQEDVIEQIVYVESGRTDRTG